MPNRTIAAPAESIRTTTWVLLGVSTSLTTVILIWWLRSPGTFLPERLGVGPAAFRSPWPWLLAAAVAAGYSWYTLRSVPFVDRHKWTVNRFKLVGVWAALVSGVVEEVVFRQLLMDWAAGRGIGAAGQVALSAVVFGAAHALWLLLHRDRALALPVVAATSVLGALLALVYLAAGRHVLPCIAAHVAVNLVIEPWLILAAVSGRFRAPTDVPE